MLAMIHGVSRGSPSGGRRNATRSESYSSAMWPRRRRCPSPNHSITASIAGSGSNVLDCKSSMLAPSPPARSSQVMVPSPNAWLPYIYLQAPMWPTICRMERAHPGGTADHSACFTQRRLVSRSSSSLPSNASSIRYTSCSIAACIVPAFFPLTPGPPLLHIHAAVDVDLSTRNILALGQKEAADPRDFFGPAKASERDLREQRLLNVLRKIGHHFRLDEARTESIDRNVELRQFLCRRLRETDDPGLRRRVVRLPEVPHLPDDRRHVHNSATPALDHVWHGGVRAVEDAVEVGRHYLAPLLDAHAPDRAVAVDASVVHENIDTAESLHRLFDQPVAVVRMSDTGLDDDRLLLLSFHLGQQFVRRFLVRVVVQDNLSAVVREFAGAGAAQAAGAAGDNGDFVGQAGHKGFPPLLLLVPLKGARTVISRRQPDKPATSRPPKPANGQTGIGGEPSTDAPPSSPKR